MAITYSPDADDAEYEDFEGVDFDDPGETAYASPSNTRVDAKFFLKPIQDEVLNLIAKMVVQEGLTTVTQAQRDDAVRVRLAMSNAAIFGASQFI